MKYDYKRLLEIKIASTDREITKIHKMKPSPEKFLILSLAYEYREKVHKELAGLSK